MSPIEIATGVLQSYSKEFNKHFPNSSAADFIQKTNEVVDFLEELVQIYPEVLPTKRGLASMIAKFTEDETKRHHATK